MAAAERIVVTDEEPAELNQALVLQCSLVVGTMMLCVEVWPCAGAGRGRTAHMVSHEIPSTRSGRHQGHGQGQGHLKSGSCSGPFSGPCSTSRLGSVSQLWSVSWPGSW